VLLGGLMCLLPTGNSFAAGTGSKAADSSVSSDKTAEDILFWELPDVYGVSKKEEALKDTPMSVYTVTNEEMNRWGIRSLGSFVIIVDIF
jgi:hypothetical protein